MKLDLLYEFQPKIKPWSKPHPYGQREAEQRTYDEAIAEIQFADKLGFNTVWCVEHHFRDGRSACPSNEVVLGGGARLLLWLNRLSPRLVDFLMERFAVPS